MSTPVHVGIIGLGFMGQTHIKAYRQIPGAQIVAICDAVRLPEDGKLTGVAGNIATTDAIHFDLSVVKGYRDYGELLANPDVHLVDICVPTSDHPQLSVAALQAGKHVICEKPMARTSALAREITVAAERARTYFIPAMCMRFWPGWAWLKEALADQRYGRALAMRFRRVSSPPGWSRNVYFNGRESGGALLDLHIHDTDFVQFLFGRPKRVNSTGVTVFSGAIDHVVTQYDVGGGVSVSAEGSWILPDHYGFNMAYTLICERATVDYDLSRGAEALKVFEEGRPPRVVATESDGYVGELSYLLDCIQQGRAPTVVSARDGLSAVEICEAEERSVNSGEWQTV